MSKLFPLILKEIKLTSKRKALLFMIFGLPLFFGLVFTTYQEAIPTDTPIAVVIDDKNLSQAQVNAIMAIARTFSSPNLEPSVDSAVRKLQREEYYVVIEIKNYRDFTNASYVVYYDDSMTPVAAISENLLEILRIRMGATQIEARPLNRHASLPEFFFPGVLVMLSVLVGMELIPSTAIEERGVLPRLKLYSSLPLNFTAKVLVGEGIILVQAGMAKLVYDYAGSDVGLSWWVLLVLLLTTLYLSLIGLCFVFAFRFEGHSKSLLQITAGFLALMSGLLYPAGFFPSAFQRLDHLLPTYYSGVLLRAFMFRKVNPGLFWDYLGYLVLTIVLLALINVLLYRRVKEWSTL
ncbi:hypothetical protein A3L09_00515 [Thermococcus profundus]|uniref:ABC-2 type transporter transmembrane domain-containing protein n=1 Tax=Thermococcus profundus TaxID=49899 RepID=A0A2Z2M6S8_THEPR|nr:hypothetical protein A3L09_00515 [Thermococcus profundus]